MNAQKVANPSQAAKNANWLPNIGNANLILKDGQLDPPGPLDVSETGNGRSNATIKVHLEASGESGQFVQLRKDILVGSEPSMSRNHARRQQPLFAHQIRKIHPILVRSNNAVEMVVLG